MDTDRFRYARYRHPTYIEPLSGETYDLKITSKRQVTLPAQVLDALGVGPGDQLELEESPGGFILRPRRIDYSKLGSLKDKIDPTVEPFDIEKFRSEPYAPSLRD